MSTPLRILHAIRSDGFAGVEQFVLRLATAQASDGHRVAVIGGDGDRMRPMLDAAQVDFTPAARTIDVARAVRRRASDLDVVNTHMTAADVGATAALADRGRHRPGVVATRHFAQPRGRVGPVRIDALVGRRIDAQIAISAAVAASVDGPSTIVHPGVESRGLGDGRSRARTVLMAQRLEREKHTEVGIRAFARSELAAHGWALEIAGAGSERAALEQVVGSLGLDGSVRFLGFRSDLPELMDRSGILLASCPFEHFGLTVLEAMSGGLPVVAAEAAGHREMLEGLDPRAMFAPDDEADAAERLRSLADDAAGRDALGSAERERQQRDFSLRAQVDGTDAVYRGVL